MNNEYLWSKTGSDAEIEKLEGLLGEFRFGEDPPELPATNIIPVARVSKRRWVFGLSFATATAALVLMVLWFAKAPVTQVAKVEYDADPTQETAGPRSNDAAEFRTGDGEKTVVPIAHPQRLVEPIRRQTRSTVSRIGSSNGTKKNTKLTKEEKYAYDRLMFALAITGSNLKKVQDSVDRKRDTGPQTTRNEK